MNFENIIYIISLITVGIVCYYMYTKITSQNNELIKLTKKFEAIELLLTKPPSHEEIQTMYQPNSNLNRSNPLSPLSPLSPQCESAMCDLEPLQINTNTDELDDIVNTELKVINKDKKNSTKKNI